MFDFFDDPYLVKKQKTKKRPSSGVLLLSWRRFKLLTSLH